MAAIEANDRPRARDLLTRLLKDERDRSEYWLWLSAVVESQKERAFCLKEALRLDPTSEPARRGLVLMGLQPPEPDHGVPLSLQKRSWEPTHRIETRKANRRALILYGGIGLAAVVLIVLVGIGLSNAVRFRASWVAPSNLQPIAPITATPSVTPTNTPFPDGPTPPWGVLAQPYTPTPQYVNTPHPRTEAYRIAITALAAGNWEKAIDYLQQTGAGEPGAADVQYLLGEAHRQAGNYEDALAAYEKAIVLSPSFGPAYVGRAVAARLIQPDEYEAARTDLEQAIILDPVFPQSYIALADLELSDEQPERALEALERGRQWLMTSPLLPYTRALAYFDLGQYSQAEANLEQALQLDLTMLPAYYLKAKIYQATDRVAESLEPLDIYFRNGKPADDVESFNLWGAASAAAGRDEAAQYAFSQSLDLDSRQLDIYLQRGLLYLKMNLGKEASADFDQAIRLDSRSFTAYVGMGCAQLLEEEYGAAYNALSRAENLAATDADLAEVYYWRAQSLETNNPKAAIDDWNRLLELPEDAVNDEWRQIAESHLTSLQPSATPTPR